MKTIIGIDGGIGRVITAIPALLKYGKNHPDDEWYISVGAWEYCFWGIEELQKRVINPEMKGIFETIFWDADQVIQPEPYKEPQYYRNEISLSEAFDKTINNTDDHSDLPDIKMETRLVENMFVKELMGKMAMSVYGDNGWQNRKWIVIQPYGSMASSSNLGIYDKSLRSIPDSFMKNILDGLKSDYNIINMSAANNFSVFEGIINDPTEYDMRTWISIIKQADYFIGCDSCGQHIAKGVGTDASVFIAGTHEVNISYPDDFHIIKNSEKFYPSPIRISNWTCELSEKLNEKRMVFSEEEQDEQIETVIGRIKAVPKRKKPKTLEDVHCCSRC